LPRLGGYKVLSLCDVDSYCFKNELRFAFLVIPRRVDVIDNFRSTGFVLPH